MRFIARFLKRDSNVCPNGLRIDVFHKNRETGSRPRTVRFMVFRVSRCWLLPTPPTNGSRLRGFCTVKHPVRVPLGAQFIDYTNNKEILEANETWKDSGSNGFALCDQSPFIHRKNLLSYSYVLKQFFYPCKFKCRPLLNYSLNLIITIDKFVLKINLFNESKLSNWTFKISQKLLIEFQNLSIEGISKVDIYTYS